jgi:hypothetical protein
MRAELLRSATPELRLLRAAAHPRLGPDGVRAFRHAAVANVDWPRVLPLAIAHRLVPFLSLHVEDHAADLVPDETREDLRARSTLIAARTLRQSALLAEVLEILYHARVRTLCLKGPSLALRLYGQLSLRGFADLDLLIPEHELSHALEALVAAGFHSAEPLQSIRASVVVRTGAHLTVTNADGSIPVELHPQFVRDRFSLALDVEDAFARAVPRDLLGTRMLTLADDDLLLYLCVHGCKHAWRQLEWLVSVAELIRQDAVDVESLLPRAQAVHARERLLLGLRLAHEILGAPLSAAIRKAAATDRIDGLVRDVWQLMQRGGGRLPDEAYAAPVTFRYQLRTFDRLRDRVRFAVATLAEPTDADFDRLSLPAGLTTAYWPYRVARLTTKYAARALRVRDPR